jgi:hypothetical protein
MSDGQYRVRLQVAQEGVPKSIKFNDLEGVLADVKSVGRHD